MFANNIKLYYVVSEWIEKYDLLGRIVLLFVFSLFEHM